MSAYQAHVEETVPEVTAWIVSVAVLRTKLMSTIGAKEVLGMNQIRHAADAS